MARTAITRTDYLNDKFVTASNWTPANGTWSISSAGYLESSGTAGKKKSFSNASLGISSFGVSYQASFATLTGSGGGVWLKNAGDSINIRVQPFVTGSGVSVYTNPGSGDVEYNTAFDFAANVLYNFYLRISNNKISLYINGTTILTEKELFFNASLITVAGLFTEATVCTFDNYIVSDLEERIKSGTRTVAGTRNAA